MFLKRKNLTFRDQILLAALIPAICLIINFLSLWPLQSQFSGWRNLADRVAANGQTISRDFDERGSPAAGKALTSDVALLENQAQSLYRAEALFTAVTLVVFLAGLLATVAAATSIRRRFLRELREAVDQGLANQQASEQDEVVALARSLLRSAAESRAGSDLVQGVSARSPR